jgi:hypothetical protein
VWVEPWGWTWVESEPWGFCPFHYGRWVYVGSAWGWVPGPVVVRPVYAPALVVFMGGAHFSVGISFGGGVQAWVPLGPREPYFPWYHHSDGYRQEVNVTNIRNVTNITNIKNITNINNIHYVNQRVAMTAVPTTAFSSGRRIDSRVIRVNPEQALNAQVMPHPETVPTAGALGGGRPTPAPPIRARVMTTPGTGPRPPAQPPRAVQPVQPPVVTRNVPAEPSAPRGGRGGTVGPPAPPPRLVTRNPLPPPSVPFSARQQAIQAHPGRPLEPTQLENLRAGRPAGPMRDREFPPHPAPQPRAERPQARSSPESKPAPREGPKH